MTTTPIAHDLDPAARPRSASSDLFDCHDDDDMMGQSHRGTGEYR